MAASTSLSFLLADISERLMAATHEASDTPAAEADTIAAKMQTVLLALVGNCTKTQKPKRGLLSVLKLVNLAMARLPAAFSGLRCSTALAISIRLLPLLVEPTSRSLHATILGTVKSLFTLTADSCHPAYEAVVSDVMGLLSGCVEALSTFSVPARLLPDQGFALPGFPGVISFLASAGDLLGGGEAVPPVAGHIAANAPIHIHSVDHCQLLTGALVQVVGHLLWTNPVGLVSRHPNLLPRVLLPLLKGGATVEAEVLSLLAAALPAVRPSVAQAQALAGALADTLSHWHQLKPRESAEWMRAASACLLSLTQECQGLSSPRLLSALMHIVSDEAVAPETRAALCPPLASLVSAGLTTGTPASSLLPALLCGPPGAAMLRSVIRQMRQVPGEKELNAVLSSLLSQDSLTQQDRSPPAKRRRTSPPGVVDLCSPDAGSTQAPNHTGPGGSRQDACRPLLKALLAFGDSLGASASCRLQLPQRLAALRAFLLATGGCMPGLLSRLAPAVGGWATWCLAGSGSHERSLEDVALVLGCVDALLAAVVDAELSAAPGLMPSRAVAKQSVRAKDLLAATGLAKEQMRALSQLPFAALGSPGSQQRSPASSASLLRSAKVVALRVQLGVYLLDPSDAGGPLAKTTAAAKASCDDDASVRAALASLAPAFVACALRHKPALQATTAMLLKLAGAEEAEVRSAVAQGLEGLIRCQGARENKAAAVAQACGRAGAVLGEGSGCGWLLLQPSETPAGACASEVSPEDLAAFAEHLLFKETSEAVQAYAGAAVAAWFGAASTAESSAAAALLKRWLPWAAAGSAHVRAQFLAAAPALARPQVVWGAFGGGTSDPGPEEEPSYAKAECSLLQELKCLYPDKPEEVRLALLAQMAALAQRMRGASAELLLLGMLLNCVDDERPTVRATAGSLLLDYAAAKQTSMEDVLLNQPKVLDYFGRNWLSRPALLEEVSELLGMEQRLLELRILPAALAHFMAAEDTGSLEKLASRLGLSLPELMHQYGHHVVAKHLFEGCAHFGKFINFTEKLLGESFLALLGGIMQPLIMEIIAQAGAAAEWHGSVALPDSVAARAESMLQTLGRIHNNCEDSAAFLAESDQVTRILKKYGDGLEATMASQQRAPEAAARQYQRILRCLLLLMRLMGEYIPRFLPQILVLLGSSLRAAAPESARLQALEGCMQLVDALAACSPRLLASIVNQMAVTLLEPLQEGGALAAAAARVLEAIVGRHRPLLGEQISALPPLPASLPALGRVAESLAAERGRLAPADQVQLLLRSLDHQSVNVRATALQEIRDFLNKHRQWLASLLAGSTSAASQDGLVQPTALLSSLVSALLRCCDAQAQGQIGSRVQLLCSECLGLLGAIDPARLSIERAAPDALCSSTAELLVELVSKHLVRLLRVAPSLFVLDAATFAIQELLRCYGDPGDGSQAGDAVRGVTSNALFAMLDPEVQPLVQPYLDSRYSLVGTATSSSGIVFNRGETAFSPWLSMWLRQLIDGHAAGELLPLFQACKLVMRRDVQTCLFLTPYVIQNVLSNGGPQAQAQVRLEIEAVLREGHTSKEGELCVQAIFSLVDVLRKWATDLRGRTARDSASASKRSSAHSPEEAEVHTQGVMQLIDSIPLDALAQAAFKCGAHARALQYYESYVRAKGGGALNPAARNSVAYADDDVDFLQELYSKLEEPDGLAGLMRLRKGGPRQEDQVLAAEQAGRWSEAAGAFEQALCSTSSNPAGGFTAAHRGRLRCAFQMSHLASMLAQVDEWSGTMQGEGLGELAAIGAAGAWRLGRWRQLDTYLEISAANNVTALRLDDAWEVRIGRLLSSIHNRERATTKRELEAARLAVMPALSAAASESYTRAYPHLVRLHMVQELSDTAMLLQEGSVAGTLERQRRLRWEERLKVTQSSLSVQEPILALRRQLAAESMEEREAGQCWLQHARGCRAAGHLEAATFAALEAKSRGVAGSEIEHARLLWDMDESNRAIQQLSQDLAASDAKESQQRTQLSPEAKAEVNHGRTRMLLQLAEWKALKGQGDQNEIKGLFNRAIGLESNSEKCYFQFAQYLDQLMQGAKQRQEARAAAATSAGTDRIGGKSRIQIGEDRPFVEYVAEVIKNYGHSVRYGQRFIHQALPRLLTVYFDFGSHMLGLPGAPGAQDKAAQRHVGDAMQRLVKELPLYAWLVVLPQLTSRICHPHPATHEMVKHILTRVTGAYPQQAFWALASVSKSRVVARREAASFILRTARQQADRSSERRQMFTQFPALCDHLIALCHHNPGDKVRVMSAKSDTSALMRMMPLSVVIPSRSSLGLVLPPGGRMDRDHTPFSDAVTIAGMKDRIEVMSSLQRPKKVVLLGSDGREYAFLVKPDDDLRKDSRMMETAGLLNRLFAKDPASRRRNLYIRRFAVTPLTESCGLIEWVHHTTGLRNCCQSVYVAAGKFDRGTNAAIKQMYDSFQGSQMRVLLDGVLALFPPMLHRFFVSQWPEPAAWHTSRTAFSRTAAVWCMVGHMLGLGDRHGENIMVDTRTGDCVHIDFACLFDKGLTLAKPEMVPFRLTQNVVDACGVSGHEGGFRRVCEITLRVLREHRGALASVLETFLHDPLVDWTSSRAAARVDAGEENPQAQDAMATIQGRLTGTLLGVRSTPSLPLSVESQVHWLIEEATSKENLGKMYIWWMPWF